MKNLDELGVQEMDVREMKEENGGSMTASFISIISDAINGIVNYYY